MAWVAPRFTFFEQSDGQLLAVDEHGKPLTCQPNLIYRDVEGVQTVVDPWGNPVDQYEFPPYTIHVYTNFENGMETGVAVDADGVPLPLMSTFRVARAGQAGGTADVVLPDGSEKTLPAYGGPSEYFVHVASSGTSPERGGPEYEMIAVDADGVPLPMQPQLSGYPDKPESIHAMWGKGGPIATEPYEFPKFSVHLDYPEGALRGASSTPPVPIAIGDDGRPLSIQPTFQTDPADPTKVVAVLPGGDLYDPPLYEFPRFRVQLEYPAAAYHGAAAPVPTPIAVDENGIPLSVQPDLLVDPTDHTQVTATLSDQSTVEVEVQQVDRNFYVHVEASGGEHGAPQFAAIAVDRSGQPLPIQPHLVVDTTDPSKVTAMFPDGTSYQPPNLYPPAGEQPEVWPPPPGQDDVDEEEETDDETGLGADAVADVSEPLDVEQDAAVADGAQGAASEDADSSDDPAVVGAEAQSVDTEDESVAAPVEDDLLTAGLDAPADPGVSAGRTPEPVEADMEPIDPSEVADLGVAAVESLVTAGLDEVIAETGAVGFEVETPTASPDLIPENDLTAATAAEVFAAEPDEVGLPIPTAMPILVEETPDQAGTVAAEDIEETALLEPMSEMKLSEVEDATVAPIEVRIEVPESELGRAAAEFEEPVERLEDVEADIEDDEEGRL